MTAAKGSAWPGRKVTTLMLTALDATADIVTGFDAGAEYYLTKPYSFPELLARLSALIRRRTAPAISLRFAGLSMDTATRTVAKCRRAAQRAPKAESQGILTT